MWKILGYFCILFNYNINNSGFSDAEARLGLRATKGNVTEAVDYISENRLKRYEARKKALAEEIYEKCVNPPKSW